MSAVRVCESMGVARPCVCWDGPQHEYAAVSQTLLPYLSVGQYACRLISQMGAAAARCVEGRGRASGYMESLVVLPDLSLRPLLQTLVLLFSGPAHWKELAPACGGPTQSPINIDLRLVQRDYTLKPFIFQGYDSAPQDPWVLENDGHTGQHHKVKTATQKQDSIQLTGTSPIHRDEDPQMS